MEQLNINLRHEDEEKEMKINKINRELKASAYQPTMAEIWETGYLTKTGKRKVGIMQTKLSDRDRERLQDVRTAIENGEVPIGLDDLKRFTKTHAMRLYKILMESRKSSTIQKMIDEIPANYQLINEEDAFEELLGLLALEEEIALDTETTGLMYEDRICGVSITLPKADLHVYIPVRHTEGKQLAAGHVFGRLRPYLEDQNLKIIFFNAKFDVHMLIKEGIRVANVWFDGYIGMKILSENEPSYSLKNLSSKYGKHFGFQDRSATYEELFGRGGFQDTPFEYKGGPGIGVVYACKDTHLTYRFYKDFIMHHFDRLPKLKELYFGMEQKVTEVCIDMEQNGLRIDFDYAKAYSDELRSEIAGLEAELVGHFGDININSPAQLSVVLYDELDLPDLSKKRSTDAKTLKRLSYHHDGLKTLLKYRELTKLLSTYIDPLPQLVWSIDSRLHGSFNQILAETGRFSSSGPNLQNLPLEARKIVVPSVGNVIVGSDYSQIEPRILAHMTGDESLIDAYVQNKDLYIEMAMNVFNLDREYCVDKAYDPTGTFQPRKAIKSVLLGIMYGMGAKSLSENVGVSVETAEGIIDDFYVAYPSVRNWIDESIAFAEENEYIETLYGRKRRFPGFRQLAKRYHAVVKRIVAVNGELPKNIWKSDVPYTLKKEYWEVAGPYNAVCRKVVNTRIQGSAADVMKFALIEVSKVAKRYGWWVIATIHDEILLEMPVQVSQAQIDELEEAMLGVVTLSLPLKVDTAFMPERWGVEIGRDEWFGGEQA